MGAKVAMAVSSRCLTSATEEKLPPVKGLLLLAPAPPGSLVLPEEIREQQAVAYEDAESVEWTVREMLTAAKGAGLAGGKTDLEMIVRDSLAGSKGARKGWPEVGMAEEIDVSPLGERRDVKVRVLVARGDRVETADRVEKETVERLKQNRIDVAFRIIEPDELECGHLLPLEAPDAVSKELIDLLNNIRKG